MRRVANSMITTTSCSAEPSLAACMAFDFRTLEQRADCTVICSSLINHSLGWQLSAHPTVVLIFYMETWDSVCL